MTKKKAPPRIGELISKTNGKKAPKKKRKARQTWAIIKAEDGFDAIPSGKATTKPLSLVKARSRETAVQFYENDLELSAK